MKVELPDGTLIEDVVLSVVQMDGKENTLMCLRRPSKEVIVRLEITLDEADWLRAQLLPPYGTGSDAKEG